MLRRVLFLAGLMGYMAHGALAQSDDPGVRFFETAIRPALVEHCYECHSAEAEQEGTLEAGLFLDSKQGMLSGGDAGPAILPGDPENSLLLAALRRSTDQMPPGGRLPDEVIDRFAKWVAMGAPDPRNGGTVAPTPRRAAFEITDTDRAHWSFQPVRKPPLPAVLMTEWPRGDIDRFVLSQLEEQGLAPNRAADKSTLIRRTTYALTGLPPTPAEVQEFLQDERNGALELVVDRLLASPEFGVHWARHWLDGVRYADSVDKSGEYRKWVIRAFNSDLPYDQFVRMQLAGDLLPADEAAPQYVHPDGASLDGITATGMLSLAVWEIVGRDLAVAEIVDSQIDVVGRHFLGLTLACARCHDHKFDPISTSDYYSLAGIFFSSHIVTGKLVADNRLANELTSVALLNVEQAAANRQIDDEIAGCESRIAALEAAVPQALRLRNINRELEDLTKQIADAKEAKRKELDANAETLKAERESLEADRQANGWEADPPELSELDGLRKQIDGLKRSRISAAQAVAVLEGGVPGSSREGIGDAPIYLRGEYQQPGPVVPRRFPAILAGEGQNPVSERTEGSGRLELAEWITSPANPLTARVMANRLWQQMIGKGLVRTPDNFGRLGEPPTHPELLDHLAQQFVASGWSVKELLRSIALSATFQQSSLTAQDAARADPENRLLARMNRRRLTYEELRDTLHLISNRLAPAAQSAMPKDSPLELRTIYAPVDRNSANRTAAMFDFPDSKTIVAQRTATTTAPQALFLMNNPLLSSTAERVAEQLAADPDAASDDDRLNTLWLTVFGREPEAAELDEARSFIGRASWPRLIHALLATNEFVYLD